MHVWLQVLYFIIGLFLFLFFLWLALSSLREKRSRAVWVSLSIVLLVSLFWYGWFWISGNQPGLLFIPVGLSLLIAILFFMPLRKTSQLKIGQVTELVDERTTAFAREEYLPGTDKYAQYYALHPEHKEPDDLMRKLPVLLEPGGKYYDPTLSPKINSIFAETKALLDEVDGEVASIEYPADPVMMSAILKNRARELGADEVGVAKLNPMWVYSHVGRGPEPWGAPIVNNHKFAVMFTVEMAYPAVEQAPYLPITEETARKYHKAAVIAVELAKSIRSVGYSARAHISESNYQIMMPPVAYDAGLGEPGRHGYLISKKFGSRIRLGGITTDIPLKPDLPISFGVQDFCEKCMKCAENCPSSAISDTGKVDVRGVEKWPLNIERCIRYWRTIGTDCGLCMKVCPFSHPPTLVHNIVRKGIGKSSFAREISIRGDNLLYGRKAVK